MYAAHIRLRVYNCSAFPTIFLKIILFYFSLLLMVGSLWELKSFDLLIVFCWYFLVTKFHRSSLKSTELVQMRRPQLQVWNNEDLLGFREAASFWIKSVAKQAAAYSHRVSF